MGSCVAHIFKIKHRCGWLDCSEYATYRWVRKVNPGFMFLCDAHLKSASNVHIYNEYEELEDSEMTRADVRQGHLNSLNAKFDGI